MAASSKTPHKRMPAKPARAPAAAATKAVPAKAHRPAKAVKFVEPPTEAPRRREKLVRDSFTIPKAEYAVLDGLKKRAIVLACPVKKSELLRAGIKALAAMSDAAFGAAVRAVPAIKTGRPPAAATPAPAPATAKTPRKARPTPPAP